jgi:exodeoxyribonuclease VIII
MNPDYASIEALNWSTLRHLATSALLLQWRADHPQPDSRAMMLGRAIHCAVLEPERWASDYIVEPDFGNLNSNAAKAERAAWLAEIAPGQLVARPCFDARKKDDKAARAAFFTGLPEGATVVVGDEDAVDLLGAGVEVLPADDHALATRCAEAVRSHPVAADMLSGGRAEEIVTWTDDEFGIPCKARMDFITPRFVLDLKSSRADSLRAISREFAGRMYHGQLAMYHDGAVAARAINGDDTPRAIVVQTVEPYDVVPARLMRGDLDRGRSLYRSLMRQYVECQAAGWWPGLAPGLVDLDLPAWAPGGDAETEVEW